jgi:uncharacterized transporter YbjL
MMHATLFLDDSVVRQQRFAREYPDAVIVSTAEDAIAMLKLHAFSVAHLDHDLGDEIYVDSGRPDTGMEVVRWIVENRPVVGKVVVHTMNHEAGPVMVERLRNAGYDAEWVPFSL